MAQYKAEMILAKKVTGGRVRRPERTDIFFKIYALDKKLDLPEGSKLSQIQKAIQGHITGEVQLIGLYQRK